MLTKNGQTYQWAAKGTRPRQPADQRYENAYIFGAVCPEQDKGAALVMPYANTEAMQKHLEEISWVVAENACLIQKVAFVLIGCHGKFQGFGPSRGGGWIVKRLVF